MMGLKFQPIFLNFFNYKSRPFYFLHFSLLFVFLGIYLSLSPFFPPLIKTWAEIYGLIHTTSTWIVYLGGEFMNSNLFTRCLNHITCGLMFYLSFYINLFYLQILLLGFHLYKMGCFYLLSDFLFDHVFLVLEKFVTEDELNLL